MTTDFTVGAVSGIKEIAEVAGDNRLYCWGHVSGIKEIAEVAGDYRLFPILISLLHISVPKNIK